MDDPKPPQSFSEQMLRYADDYRKQARELRASTSMLENPPPNPEADRLDAVADEMTKQAISSDAANDAARVKANLDKWLGDHKALADWHNENAKSLISMSQTSIRLQVTINAGAAVALLAFLGNAINKNAGTVASLFSDALAVFAAGVAVASVVSIGSYITQFLYGKESANALRWARRLHAITFALGFISLGLFVTGCFQTYGGMRAMAQLAIGGTAQPSLSQSPIPASHVNATTEVPAMAEPPVKRPPPVMANDNAPKPFKTPPPQASVPPPAPPPSPAKK